MRTFRRETVLYLVAFVLALAVRLIKLGDLPLTDLESRWALQALGVARGTHPALEIHPAYILLTSILFFLYGGGTSFLARLIPALAGSALVLVPFLFREKLKYRPAVILAFLLAFEPGLVAISRQAGSGILSITFLLLAWGFWETHKAPWAGVFAGLALLSGPMLWPGLLGLGLTWAICQGLEGGFRSRPSDEESPEHGEPHERRERSEWLSALWFALGTLVLVGTLFFLVPSGLGAWPSTISDYVSGWTQSSGISDGLVLFSLVAYQPLALVLALVVILRGWFQNSRRVKRLSVWMLVALLLAVFYPSHKVSDLAWMLVPLWALVAIELARSLDVHREERTEVLGMVALSVLILVFVWFDFLGLIQSPAGTDQSSLRLWLLVGSLFLLVVSLLLVGIGWSIRSARLGAVLGLTAVLGVYSFGSMLSAAGLREVPNAVEMWSAGRSLGEPDLLLTTVDQMSDWSMDNINSQPVTIAGVDSPALQWLLRDHQVNVLSSLPVSTTPPIVITPSTGGTDDFTLTTDYRGQAFVWREVPQWDQMQSSGFVQWLAFHQVPTNVETIIVWVRSDLFIDSTAPKP